MSKAETTQPRHPASSQSRSEATQATAVCRGVPQSWNAWPCLPVLSRSLAGFSSKRVEVDSDDDAHRQLLGSSAAAREAPRLRFNFERRHAQTYVPLGICRHPGIKLEARPGRCWSAGANPPQPRSAGAALEPARTRRSRVALRRGLQDGMRTHVVHITPACCATNRPPCPTRSCAACSQRPCAVRRVDLGMSRKEVHRIGLKPPRSLRERPELH